MKIDYIEWFDTVISIFSNVEFSFCVTKNNVYISTTNLINNFHCCYENGNKKDIGEYFLSLYYVYEWKGQGDIVENDTIEAILYQKQSAFSWEVQKIHDKIRESLISFGYDYKRNQKLKKLLK